MASQHKPRYYKTLQHKATAHKFEDFLTPDQLKTMDELDDEGKVQVRAKNLGEDFMEWVWGERADKETVKVPLIQLNGMPLQ